MVEINFARATIQSIVEIHWIRHRMENICETLVA